MDTNLYFFNWPSHIGGADTKLAHLLPLLAGHYHITLVPNERLQLEDAEWSRWARDHGFQTMLADSLPARLTGWAVSLCNSAFIGKAHYLKAWKRGLKVVWSNEMMWNFKAELGAILLGRIDTVLFTSHVQRQILEPGYRGALLNTEPLSSAEEKWGKIPASCGAGHLRWVETGNYINPQMFPFRPRRPPAPGRVFTAGRVSRPDPDKFPDDFPHFYESLGLRAPVRFRVLGWSPRMASLWPDHPWDERWDLRPAGSVPVTEFYDSLDILVYEVSPRFRESWGRSVVEAMLCGVVPLVPADSRHHLRNLVPHGLAGFHCGTAEEFGKYARLLQDDPRLLEAMSHAARDWAVKHLCHAEEHLALWHRVFEG